MKIGGREFQVIDAYEKMTVPDCFVVAANKVGSAHGEAKFYVGNENGITRGFFGDAGFVVPCFLLKKDLIEFLTDVRKEYFEPTQAYRSTGEQLARLWDLRYNEVRSLPDILRFDIAEQTQIKGSRVYVNSQSAYYQIIRTLSLPDISYLSAIKLATEQGDEVFYFKLFADYSVVDQAYAEEEEVKKIDQSDALSDDTKSQIKSARIGQGKYRQALLNDCPFCPMTMVADDRLLIASHIKPWVQANDEEKIDPKNGFMLTPTFDFRLNSQNGG